MIFIPSLLRGDVLRIRLFAIIMLTLLISSCSGNRRSALVTDDSAEVYLAANDRLALIRVDDEDLEYLEKISGNNPQETISSLFSLDAVYIEKDDYLKRKELYDLLLKQSREDGILQALNKYGKDLRKTDFINTINELSASFDDESLLDDAIKADELYEFSLGPVLSYNIRTYGDVEAFIRVWTDEIMR